MQILYTCMRIFYVKQKIAKEQHKINGTEWQIYGVIMSDKGMLACHSNGTLGWYY